MSNLEGLLRQKEQALEHIRRAEKMERLCNNPDFRELILEEFCIRECARYVHSSADPSLNAESRADALALAQSAGHFRRYINVVSTIAAQSRGQLEGLDEAIADERAEG